ncbi:DUF2780 domain-containing protein [Vibrio sp. SCSIO 43140]|uniref:DUF2780 domain-containing protein n=1 Tax=Vibrio sp. SCSIO 43140 TaxID=2819100 RepID=UPI0020763F74|nr:DUF2780 domain-containing protein [Vibrio sp. SCSIO 43140]USD60738.1 DUF2780 domain-containing protein [Vibrio sp. SCSIO 43140]
MRTFLALSTALLISVPTHAALNLSGVSADDASSLLSSANSMMEAKDSPVVNDLVNDLSVSPEQATTGVGALLSLAQTSLGSEQQSELSSLIPGMDSLTSSGLLSSIQDMDSVKSAFSSVGLDPSMISEFAPIVLDYLGSQGASSGLMDSLTSLWQ